MSYEIDNKYWHICKICNKPIKELRQLYGGSGVYYKQVFLSHLEKDHQIDPIKYFVDYCHLIQPICPCDKCGKLCGLVLSSKGDATTKFRWKKFACGLNHGVKQWSKEAKQNRRGKLNPMYQQIPWNKNKTKDNNEILQNLSNKRKGIKFTKQHKEQLSFSAKKRKIHGHTSCKHSEETKQKIRNNTLKLIKNGIFKQTKTKPHQIFAQLLQNLKIHFEEEKQYKYWSFDFYLIQYKLYIEIDGDYFHSNPKFYPNGPKTKTQKRNYLRDIKKNNYCIKHNIKLLRIWENDIYRNLDIVKKNLCKLLELNL